MGPQKWFNNQEDRFTYVSPFYKLQLAAAIPQLLFFSTDSLGKGQLSNNPVLEQQHTNSGTYYSKIRKNTISYFTGDHKTAAAWEIQCDKKSFTMKSTWKEGPPITAFDLSFSQRLNHCTLLGAMQGEQQVQFPCVFHLPGMGTFRIHCNQPEVTMQYDAYRFHGPNEKGEPYVRMSLAGASAVHPNISYRFESVAIYPDLPGIQHDTRFDGFRKNYINIFQLNPRIRSLANNSASDACAFTVYIYAEMARKTPTLTDKLTAMDLLRGTLDQYLAGMKAYGQVGYKGGYGWNSEFDSCDSAPSLIMSACYYILDTKDMAWATRNYDGIKAWASAMMATDRNNDGLIEYGYSGNKSAENRYSQFNSYFPPQGNVLTRSLLVEMAPNAAGVKTLENACYEWKSPTGQLFLFFSLEFAPRREVLSWTKEVAARPLYKQHTAIVITHSYLNSTGKRIEKENYAVTDANYGEAIYKELVQPAANIRFVFSGHIGNSDEHRDQVGYRLDTNAAKKEIHQIVFNAQREGGGWHGNGGDGWLRILEFMPDKRTMKVYTFSPFFFISPATRHLAWRREAYDQFVIRY